MRNDLAYDEESYPDIYTIAIEHCWSDQQWFFEISEERNDYLQLCEFIYHLRNVQARMVGFNNIGYDYRLLHAIVTRHLTDAYSIWQVTNEIIMGSDPWAYSVWDSDVIVPQIDLYKIHHFDNRARSTSLKALEFNMRSHNIEDLPFTPGEPVGVHNYPTLRRYNKHDTSETKKFYHHSLDAISMREELSVKYNKNFLNHNDTKIGKDYFIMKLEEAIPGSCYYHDGLRKQPRQTVRASIPLVNVVFDYIKFEQSEFNRILQYFKSQTITETKGVFKDLHCEINGFEYHFGSGGIHGSVKSQIVRNDDEFMIIDIDVASYYPNLAIANQLYPEHLSDQFCLIYQDVYNQRKATDKKSPENAMLKLALNGVYGDSNNIYSPFYDPAYTMAITINGQLLLCMLAEQLIKIPDLMMIQINTDGLTVKVNRHFKEQVDTICRWWENFTLLQLELVEYKAMYIRDVNNYIGEYTDGKLKRKGAYAHNLDDKRELPWHKDHSALVVKKAAESALVRNIPPEQFIKNHNDVMDFMLRAKVPRSSKLVGVLNNEDILLENVQRYYITNDPNGLELVKIMPPLKKKPDVYRRIGISVGWKVAPCNNLDNVTKSINFDYYIAEAKKLIDPLLVS